MSPSVMFVLRGQDQPGGFSAPMSRKAGVITGMVFRMPCFCCKALIEHVHPMQEVERHADRSHPDDHPRLR